MAVDEAMDVNVDSDTEYGDVDGYSVPPAVPELTGCDSDGEDCIGTPANDLPGNQLKAACTVTARSSAACEYLSIAQERIRTLEEEESNSDSSKKEEERQAAHLAAGRS
ncbi:hypothetical protein PoB_005810000 [Plakobranchus ocellatus]|uniref:Uncharacterized protein n=1 Tax=Plakobranchus ocellatus TaxID=259542 RepID=A0AAV4CIG2_9GAST|nr:hypothetical protein PoB_005810000 [Plakobranchus ocellatus]